jgi:hypothetical protein
MPSQLACQPRWWVTDANRSDPIGVPGPDRTGTQRPDQLDRFDLITFAGLPDPGAIGPYDSFPDFSTEYQARRSAEAGPVLFECEHEILPPHDINSAGLLYFANSEPNEPLVFYVHERNEANDGTIERRTTISRKSDDMRMAEKLGWPAWTSCDSMS